MILEYLSSDLSADKLDSGLGQQQASHLGKWW